MIREAIEQGGLDRIDDIISVINSTGALDYARSIAEQETAKAIECLQCLPDSNEKAALTALAWFSIQRQH